ncbi:MAG: hypothetical protein II133_02880 [Lachnospiraceae bacterium]|nr:hypothetical protein [Lachnospiraceae bacterium]
MLDKLERKLGKYAIPRLMNWFIAGYVIGYILEAIDASSGSDIISLMTLEPYYILHGQIWRIITWVMIPPAQNIIFAIIMIIFYWQLGRALEQVWGTFRFNVYMFGGMIITVIAAIILYLVAWAVTGNQMISLGNYFSTDYINLSIFLAFALTFPEEIVLLYFFIPVKMKWMAYLYLIFVAIDVIQAIGMGMAGIPIIVAIAASLLNFLIYFLQTRGLRGPRQMRRQRNFRRAYNSGQQWSRWQNDSSSNSNSQPKDRYVKSRTRQAKHKCCICGRTELTNPELDFRYCTKCNGNYEYCSDHLFTHTHVK